MKTDKETTLRVRDNLGLVLRDNDEQMSNSDTHQPSTDGEHGDILCSSGQGSSDDTADTTDKHDGETTVFVIGISRDETAPMSRVARISSAPTRVILCSRWIWGRCEEWSVKDEQRNAKTVTHIHPPTENKALTVPSNRAEFPAFTPILEVHPDNAIVEPMIPELYYNRCQSRLYEFST